ncbi:MAG: NAD(P)-binding protein, partial [Thermoplasmata archaeon]
MDTDFQYIIVGAGSTGASISYYLSEMTKDILLLDRSGAAQGIT